VDKAVLKVLAADIALDALLAEFGRRTDRLHLLPRIVDMLEDVLAEADDERRADRS